MNDIKRRLENFNKWLHECCMLHDAIITNLTFRNKQQDYLGKARNVLKIELKLPIDNSCKKYATIGLSLKNVNIMIFDLNSGVDALYLTRAKVSIEKSSTDKLQSLLRMKVFGERYLFEKQKWSERLVGDVSFEAFEFAPMSS